MVSLFCLPAWRGRDVPWRDQERGEHGLQPMDERVGFLVALKQRLDLRVLHGHLAAQKFIFLFEEDDVPILRAANGRVRSRLFAAVRAPQSPLFSIVRTFASVRVWSRPFATVRTSLM